MPEYIEGPYQLDGAILFRGEALGREHPVRIGDIDGVIGLPKLPGDWASLAPDARWGPLASPRLEYPQFEAGYAVMKVAWGRPYNRPPGDSAVEAVLLRFATTPDGGRELGDRVAAAVRPWFRRVRAWLSALTLQDLNSDEPHTGAFIEGEGLRLQGFDAGGKSYFARTAQGGFFISQSESVLVSTDAWRTALDRVSAGSDLAVEHQLMIDARGALRRRNNRRAVLEAATAGEVVLTAAVRAALSPRNETAVVEKMLKDNRTLGGRVRLCKLFNVAMPDGVEAKLADPRNLAIHGGVVPTDAEAGEAVRVAAEIVKTHSTLS